MRGRVDPGRCAAERRTADSLPHRGPPDSGPSGRSSTAARAACDGAARQLRIGGVVGDSRHGTGIVMYRTSLVFRPAVPSLATFGALLTIRARGPLPPTRDGVGRSSLGGWRINRAGAQVAAQGRWAASLQSKDAGRARGGDRAGGVAQRRPLLDVVARPTTSCGFGVPVPQRLGNHMGWCTGWFLLKLDGIQDSGEPDCAFGCDIRARAAAASSRWSRRNHHRVP